MPYHSFTEMPVWKLAMEIVKEVYLLTEKLPKKEDYALCGQTRKAAISIAGNIAEGFGRNHTKDKLNFYYYSRGSAHEVISHLLCVEKVNYFTQVEIISVHNKCKMVIEELNKIIKRVNTNSQPQPQPQP